MCPITEVMAGHIRRMFGLGVIPEMLTAINE
jgi:hypothetical protein